MDLLVAYIGALCSTRAVQDVLGLAGLSTTKDSTWGQYGGLLTFVAMVPTYFCVAEVVAGRTVGMLFTGARVVGQDGRRLPARSTMMRTAMRFVPLDGLSCLFAPDGRGWHDRVAGAFVVVHADAHAERGGLAEVYDDLAP